VRSQPSGLVCRHAEQCLAIELLAGQDGQTAGGLGPDRYVLLALRHAHRRIEDRPRPGLDGRLAGFVEEAGGGRGRERPWRQSYDSMSWRTRQDDPQASQAAEALDQVWLDRTLARARRSLTSMAEWPKGLDSTLGGSTSTLYLTPEEADALFTELRQTFDRVSGPRRYKERKDPKHRPAGAIPIEFTLFGYPVFDLPPLPAADAGADGESDDDDTAAEGLVAPD
jgi:hypothetical protein